MLVIFAHYCSYPQPCCSTLLQYPASYIWHHSLLSSCVLAKNKPMQAFAFVPTSSCHHVENGADIANVALQVAFISPLATVVIRVTGSRLVHWTAAATSLGQCTVAAVAASASPPHRMLPLALKVRINMSSTSVSPLTAAGL